MTTLNIYADFIPETEGGKAIALARPVGNHSHYRSALKLGMSKEQIMELIIQVGHYAGWPTIALAARQFAEVLKEEAEQGKGQSRYV